MTRRYCKPIILIAALLLTACASPMKRYGPGSGYNYSPEFDRCVAERRGNCTQAAPAMVIDGYIVPISHDAAERDAWIEYHLRTPALDDAEIAAIKRIKTAQYWDQGTTLVGLACGLKEGNPLFAGSRVILAPVVHWGIRRSLTSWANKSARAFSSAPYIEHYWIPNASGAAWNIGKIASVCL